MKSLRCSEKALDRATLPVSKDTRLPPPRACLMCSLIRGRAKASGRGRDRGRGRVTARLAHVQLVSGVARQAGVVDLVDERVGLQLGLG